MLVLDFTVTSLTRVQMVMPNVIVNSGFTSGTMAVSGAATLKGGLTGTNGITVTTGGLTVTEGGATITNGYRMHTPAACNAHLWTAL